MAKRKPQPVDPHDAFLAESAWIIRYSIQQARLGGIRVPGMPKGVPLREFPALKAAFDDLERRTEAAVVRTVLAETTRARRAERLPRPGWTIADEQEADEWTAFVDRQKAGLKLTDYRELGTNHFKRSQNRRCGRTCAAEPRTIAGEAGPQAKFR